MLEKIFEDYPDDIVFPLMVESDDWDLKIDPALKEMCALHNNDSIDDITLFQILRGILQITYCMGYQRGQKEQE
jgi:glutaredoxin 2